MKLANLAIAAWLVSFSIGATEVPPRDHAAHRAFRAAHPCPSTQKTTGRCPGFVVDHIIPLCIGGPDAPANMQWQPLEESRVKDRFELQQCAVWRRLHAYQI